MLMPFFMSEGSHMDHFGNLIWPVFVDFRHPTEREPIATLVKGCQAQFAVEAVGRLRISKPSSYREFGKHLIRDQNEARPKRPRPYTKQRRTKGSLNGRGRVTKP